MTRQKNISLVHILLLRTTQRKPEGAKPYLFAIGGGSLFAIHSECEVYNPLSDRWTGIASMSTRRSRAGVAGVGNMLYVVGGYDGSNDLATGECYNPQSNKVRDRLNKYHIT